MRLEMAAGRTFVHLQEAPITFRPTYKFDKHSVEPLDYDSSEKRRCLSLQLTFEVPCGALEGLYTKPWFQNLDSPRVAGRNMMCDRVVRQTEAVTPCSSSPSP